jgi:hypothetical protein
LRPDPSALARSALRSVARRALLAAKSASKGHPEKNPWPDDRAVDWLHRSPVAPTKIADIQSIAQVRVHFLPSLVPQSAAAAILSQSVQFSFDGVASISVPSMTLPFAGFVGEAQAIPVLQGTTSANVPMTPSKFAAIVTLTREMIEGGDAEAAVTQVLQENIGGSLDAAFFNNSAAVATVSPAGILNGAINVTPAATGAGDIAADIANLAQALGPVSGNSPIVLIGAPKQISAIKSLIYDPPPLFTSNALPAGTLVAIVPASIACAVGTPVIEASRETHLHMANPASDIVVSLGTVAAPAKSMFQTDSSALRFLMDITWTKRGAGVAMISGANWP